MRILLLLLCLVAAGLYVKILLPPDFSLGVFAGLEEAATQQTVTPAAPGVQANLQEIPESQMQVVIGVFAPELGKSH